MRGATSDDWFDSLHASKELGNGMYTLPLFATAWAAGELLTDIEFAEVGGRWGERSLRGFLVGAPPLIVLQNVTGGHSFMGSLPFITAAKLTDRRGLKFLYYAGSTIVPLSRVNDGAHYPSQVALGWWMAYLAANAVDATDNPNSRWSFYPYTTAESSVMMAEFRF